MEPFLDLFYYPMVPDTISAYLTQMGYDFVKSPSYRHDSQKRGDRPRCIWQYTLSGSGMIDTDNGAMAIHAGQAMLLTLPASHCYYLPSGSTHWEFIFLMMEGAEAYRVFRILDSRFGCVVDLPPNTRTLHCFHEMRSLRNQKLMREPYSVAEYTARFLFTLCKDLEGTNSANAAPEVFHKIYELLQTDEHVTVDDMVEISGYSRIYFEQLFKKHHGVTPHRFLHNLYMNKAVRLLDDTNLTIKEVAFSCGYSDPAYFCRVFGKEFHCTPNTYRQKR